MKNTQFKIVFMGTPEFAVNILEILFKKKYKIEAVVTAPDRPAGRGKKIKQSAVKIFSKKNDLKFFQPKNLKNEDFVNELKKIKPDLIIVVAFRLLPEIIWKIPKLGAFNLHASLLPQYRGAAPINWVLINGESETGVTTFFIDKNIDTGEIILQKKLKIKKNDTAGSLHDKLIKLGKQLVLKTLELISEKKINKIPQINNSYLKIAPKLNKINCRIDWKKNGMEIENQVRGLCPRPGSWTILENGKNKLILKIYEVSFIKEQHIQKKGIVVIDSNSIKISIDNGFIKLIQFKLEGKKQMNIKDFLNGYTFEPNAKII